MGKRPRPPEFDYWHLHRYGREELTSALLWHTCTHKHTGENRERRERDIKRERKRESTALTESARDHF